MNFKLTILGSNSAIPTSDRNPSAQFVKHYNEHFLIDCGEGTQLQIRKLKIRFQKINHIFISHLHGDHYFGLIGLISTLHLLGRKKEVIIYSPAGLEEIINIQLRASDTILNFPLSFVTTNLDGLNLLFENKRIQVFSFPVKHRIPTTAFLFKEKIGMRNIKKEVLEDISIPHHWFPRIKNGEDYRDENAKVIANELLTESPSLAKSYVYCTDTLYDESIIPWIEGVDLLYHEATFLSELIDTAQKTFHATALQAAMLAKKAKVKKLLIGHFSSRYKDSKALEEEAKSVFENVVAVADGDEYSI
jgi:ribonuclease Z